MRIVPLQEELFQGAVSLERTGDGVRPWRIPFADFDLFPPQGLNGKAGIPAGVRLALRSNTRSVQVSVAPSTTATQLDCVVDDQVVAQGVIAAGETTHLFSGLSGDIKKIDIYLSQQVSVTVTGLSIDEGANYTPTAVTKPRWVTYGSSITQCSAAESPAHTWPAIVAREAGLHLTCLGYGGNCHLEPMVARMMREMPASFISLCLGINVMGAASLGQRTFQAAVIGFIKILREKHLGIPMAVMSPIISPPREVTPNAVGYTLPKMRQEIAEAVEILQQKGDHNLFYVDGLEIFGEEDVHLLPDLLHPNAEGYKLMGERFLQRVIKRVQGTWR